MRYAQVPSLDAAQRWALNEILENGILSAPRGQATREVLCVGFHIEHPRRRCVIVPERKWSLPLAIGEFCWHASGSDDVEFIAHYARRWRQFSDDGKTISGSCYGKRIFERVHGISQWDNIRQVIESDMDTRRAVLFFDSAQMDRRSVDVPCASTMQFFVRGGALHASVTMRSNDIIFGLPYDVFLFTTLQELMACQLGIPLGTYSHFAASLHLYNKHMGLARRIVEATEPEPFDMPTMVSADMLPSFLEAECRVRAGIEEQTILPIRYWQDLLSILRLWKQPERAEAILSDVPEAYRPVLAPLFIRRR